jgi:hypothetical protein
MANGKPRAQRSGTSEFISVGKDCVSLLRDATLFLLAALLVVFPTTFNSILVQAGFEEGSIVGFKWKSKLIESNSALQEAQSTIADLQKKNDEMAKVLAEANTKLADPSFGERIIKLEHENSQLKEATQQVQTTVSRTIESNTPFVEKALSLSNQPTSSLRQTSDYLVGLQTLGIADEARKDLNAKLLKAGYSLHDISVSYQLSDRPSWFAQRSTVFYYSRSALPAAKGLAQLLKGLTGEDFAIQRGAGLGVDPGQRDVTLFVHYTKS